MWEYWYWFKHWLPEINIATTLFMSTYLVISHRKRQQRRRAELALFDSPPDEPAPDMRPPDRRTTFQEDE